MADPAEAHEIRVSRPAPAYRMPKLLALVLKNLMDNAASNTALTTTSAWSKPPGNPYSQVRSRRRVRPPHRHGTPRACPIPRPFLKPTARNNAHPTAFRARDSYTGSNTLGAQLGTTGSPAIPLSHQRDPPGRHKRPSCRPNPIGTDPAHLRPAARAQPVPQTATPAKTPPGSRRLRHSHRSPAPRIWDSRLPGTVPASRTGSSRPTQRGRPPTLRPHPDLGPPDQPASTRPCTTGGSRNALSPRGPRTPHMNSSCNPEQGPPVLRGPLTWAPVNPQSPRPIFPQRPSTARKPLTPTPTETPSQHITRSAQGPSRTTRGPPVNPRPPTTTDSPRGPLHPPAPETSTRAPEPPH